MSKLNYYRFLFKYLGLVIFKRKTMGGAFEEAVAARTLHPALRFDDEVISYEALNRRANRRAHFLASLGIGKGDAIALVMENRPEYLETIIGVAKLGGITALINHNLRGRSLAHCINAAQAKCIIAGRECLEGVREVVGELEGISEGQVYVDTRWPGEGADPGGLTALEPLLDAASEANPTHPPMNSKDPVLYIYTSGTTGLPKAARINHYRWYAAGLAMGTYGLGAKPLDTVHCPLPLYHSNGILIAFGSAIVNKATLSLVRKFSVSNFWDEVTRLGATCFIYIGELLRYLHNAPPSPQEKTHKVTRILGNGLRPDIWDSFQSRTGIAHIREFYASTEGNAILVNMGDVSGSMGTCVLKASDNTAVVKYDVEKDDYVRDEAGFCVKAGADEVGELVGEIKLTTPFYGYTNKQDSDKKILQNVFKKGDAFFRTGDLVTRDANGYYFFVDRIGDTYRWKGENVSTQEVQETLSGFPGVKLVSVYGVNIPGTEGRAGMAALQMGGEGLDGGALGQFVATNLPHYAQPLFVRLVEDMDITGTFKLRKTTLQEDGFDPEKVKGTLLYLDKDASRYLPLDGNVFKAITGGERRF